MCKRDFIYKLLKNFLTIIKEYPIHRESQFCGQSGISRDWLCKAITRDGASQTAHLKFIKVIKSLGKIYNNK